MIKDKMLIPKNAEKEIIFMLYNYENIDKLIEQRKNDLIDTIKVTNKAHLKSIKGNGRTLEDVVASFDNDSYIKRLKEWKKIINSFKSRLYDEEDKTYYRFIILKYLRKIDEESIIEILNIEKKNLKVIDLFLKSLIYVSALDKKLF